MNKKVLWTLIYMAFIIFIFSNSIQTADDSSAKSWAVLQWMQGIVGEGWITEYIVRKAAHFSEFSVLGILGVQCFSQYKKNIIASLFSGLLIALTDETIQIFIEGRSSQVTDVWIDFTGCCVGAVIAYVVWKHRNRQGKNSGALVKML